MKHNIICIVSDCTIEDAHRVVSQYPIGSWASVNLGKGNEGFVIKTSETETTLHTPVRFGGDMLFQMDHITKQVVYTWDEFWEFMINTYGLDPNNCIIVEEDELY